jgi:hypothetical protein
MNVVVDELIGQVDNLLDNFEKCVYDERGLVAAKGECNVLKSRFYMNLDFFETHAHAFLHINKLNSLVEKIDFELNHKFKLLMKIREKAMLRMTKDEWVAFIRECKDEV